MSFYERLEDLRKSKDLSQKELETELGFSNGSISKWKKSTPTHDRMQKIANYFNVSVDYLVTGKEPEFTIEMADTDVALTNMEKRLKEYALKLADLPKDKQEQIMNLIDMLEK